MLAQVWWQGYTFVIASTRIWCWNNIKMLSCKKPDFMLCQVQSSKMLVPWIEMESYAVRCWDVFPKCTRLSDFLTHFPSWQLIILASLGTSRYKWPRLVIVILSPIVVHVHLDISNVNVMMSVWMPTVIGLCDIATRGNFASVQCFQLTPVLSWRDLSRHRFNSRLITLYLLYDFVCNLVTWKMCFVFRRNTA